MGLALQSSIYDSCIFETIGAISEQANKELSRKEKKLLGSFYTPLALAKHVVNISGYRSGKLGDHGAGSGVLSACAVAKSINRLVDKPGKIELEAFEINEQAKVHLKATYDLIKGYAGDHGQKLRYQIFGDYLSRAREILTEPRTHLSAAILNPPYYKLSSGHSLNRLFKETLGFTVPNVYFAFLILAICELKEGGTLTAIVPRSFANGRYFKQCRRYLKDNVSIESVTRFRSRSNIFKGDNLCQENAVLHLRKAKQVPSIKVFTCLMPETPPESELTVPSEILLDHPNDIIALPADQKELDALLKVRSYQHSLSSIGVEMKTGKVVAHRVEGLNGEGKGALYIEGKGFESNTLSFTKSDKQINNALRVTPSNVKLLITPQPLVLMKRISSNSDARRINLTVLSESDFQRRPLALSITTQYFIGRDRKLSDEQAKVLAEYLMSSDVEYAIRAISGTTQINLDDIGLIGFPDKVAKYF